MIISPEANRVKLGQWPDLKFVFPPFLTMKSSTRLFKGESTGGPIPLAALDSLALMSANRLLHTLRRRELDGMSRKPLRSMAVDISLKDVINIILNRGGARNPILGGAR